MSLRDWSDVRVPNFVCPVGSDCGSRMPQVDGVEGSLNTSKHAHTVYLLARQQPHRSIPVGASQPDIPTYYMPTLSRIDKGLKEKDRKGTVGGVWRAAETRELKQKRIDGRDSKVRLRAAYQKKVKEDETIWGRNLKHSFFGWFIHLPGDKYRSTWHFIKAKERQRLTHK